MEKQKIEKMQKELEDSTLQSKYGKLKVSEYDKDGFDIIIKNSKKEKILLIDTNKQQISSDKDRMPIDVFGAVFSIINN